MEASCCQPPGQRAGMRCDWSSSKSFEGIASFEINMWIISHRYKCRCRLIAVGYELCGPDSLKLFSAKSDALKWTHMESDELGPKMPLNRPLAKRCSVDSAETELFSAQRIKKQNKTVQQLDPLFNSGWLLHRLRAVSQFCTPVSHVNENHRVALDRRSWVMQCS